MNKLMMILAFAGLNASASMVENYNANLQTFNFQKDSVLEKSTEGLKVSGEVTVTPISDITLTIQRNVDCKPGQFCPAIAYPAAVYQVPVKNRKVGSCGQTIFTGFDDHRLVDGVLTKITVVDNSHNFCKYFTAVPKTQVKLEIKGGQQNLDELHTMTGDQMVELQ